MSFYSHFRKKSIPEWREYYVSYKVFKLLFQPFKKTSKIYAKMMESKIQLVNPMYSMDVADLGEEFEQLRVFEEKINALISIETEKTDSFFELKFMEFQDEWSKIQENAEILKPYRFDKKYYTKAQMLKNAFQMYYMKVNYLIHYVNLNYDALSRILRKHQKLTKNYTKMMQVSTLKIEDLFKNKYINRNSDSLIHLREEVTNTYLDLFYNRYNKDQGVKELKFLLKTRIISVWHSYFLFFFLGCTICLLLFVIVLGLDGSIDPDDNDQNFKDIFPMFRGSAFIVLYIWLLGWNVYVWTKYQINYKKIFEFNYHASTATEIFMRGTFFSSILLLIFIWYIVVNFNMGKLAEGLNSLKIPKEFLPLILWVLLFAYLFFPSKKWFNGEGRLYFFKRIYRWLISPCVMIDGPSGFVADQIMSFVVPLQDLAYTICYYVSRYQDYDNFTPRSCFTDTIIVGFLVAFLPGVFRTIHFFYFLRNGQLKIIQKKKEIENIKNQRLSSFKKSDVEKTPEMNTKEKISLAVRPSEFSTPLKTTVFPETIPEIDEKNYSFKRPNNTPAPKDQAIEIQPIPNEKKKSFDIKENCSFAPKSSEEPNNNKPQKSPEEIQKDELLERKNVELKLLLDSHNLNKMYTLCLVIVMTVVIFSFLYGKYPDNQFYLIMWVIFVFILSTYAYYLDIFKDWALCQKNKKHPFLREKIGFHKKGLYYFCIVSEFFLRFVWVFSISPGTISKVMRPELFIFFMGIFEMLRRAIWNCILVEKIFMTNLDSYKCLYEYQLPFGEEDIEVMEEINRSEPIQNKRTILSAFPSSDYEEDFKVRFAKKKREDDMKKSLLEDFQLEEFASPQKGLNMRLNESVLKGKEMLDSMDAIRNDVKIYGENLKKRYNLGMKQKKQTSYFQGFMKWLVSRKTEKQ